MLKKNHICSHLIVNFGDPSSSYWIAASKQMHGKVNTCVLCDDQAKLYIEAETNKQTRTAC